MDECSFKKNNTIEVLSSVYLVLDHCFKWTASFRISHYACDLLVKCLQYLVLNVFFVIPQLEHTLLMYFTLFSNLGLTCGKKWAFLSGDLTGKIKILF